MKTLTRCSSATVKQRLSLKKCSSVLGVVLKSALFSALYCSVSMGTANATGIVLKPKATLTAAKMNLENSPAPGNITLVATLSSDRSSKENCTFNATIWQTPGSADAIGQAVASGIKLTGALPGSVGPFNANLKPGKYRIEFAVDNEAASACKGSVSAPIFEVKRHAIKFGASQLDSPPLDSPSPKPRPFIVVNQAQLTKVVLNQTVFFSMEKITLAATISSDRSSAQSCNFNAHIIKTSDGTNTLNFGAGFGFKLAGSLPGLVGPPITTDLQPGKYRVDFTVDNEATSACKGTASAPFEVQRKATSFGLPVTTFFKINSVLADQPTFNENSILQFYVLGEGLVQCSKMTAEIDGKKADINNFSRHNTLEIRPGDSLYPKKGGKHTLKLSGAAPACKGEASANFAIHVNVVAPKIGYFNGFKTTPEYSGGVNYAGVPLQMDIGGSGECQLDIALKGDGVGLLHTQRIAVALPYHYVSDYLMPPYGHYLDGDFLPLGSNNKNKAKNNTQKFTVTVTPVTSSSPVQVCTGLPKVANYETKCLNKVCDDGSQSFDPKKGKVTGFKVSGFTSGQANGKIEVFGTGVCSLRIDVVDRNTYKPAEKPTLLVTPYPSQPIPTPLVKSNLGPLPNGSYRAAVSSDSKNCVANQPSSDPTQSGWYFDFIVSDGKSAASSINGTGGTNGNNGNNGNNPVTPPAVKLPAAPANGNITSMQVPDGSFAEDETQKLQVYGTGGCSMDLRIWNTSYGGNFDTTFPVMPLALAAKPLLYNGTNFSTLAEGSYSATVTGKNGCTGNAAIDFKVNPKTSTSNVLGKPQLSLDKQPMNGSAFSKSKDSNIWFKVVLPQKIKETVNASCCDVEFNYKNSYGGWEVLPGSPFNDAGWSNAMKLSNAVVNKSVSYFKVSNEGATEWRMKVRAYKFKTTFEWSEWLEFKVDQN